MAIGKDITDYYTDLQPPQITSEGVEILFPYGENQVRRIISQFYAKFYSDLKPRRMLIGINPGRFGGGTTGIPFTDPINLAEKCLIPNDFQKRYELSSRFIYEMIEAFGGPEAFYGRFYFYSVSPVGFVKGGKNFNYYDDPILKKELEPYVVEHMHKQFEMGMDNKVAYSLGQGRNIKELQELNKKYSFFDKIIPLPHPRWIMQYRLKEKDKFIAEYMDKLSQK